MEENDNIYLIDTKLIRLGVDEGKKLCFDEDGQRHLSRLLEMQSKINQAVEQVKEDIEYDLKELNSGKPVVFVSGKVKTNYRNGTTTKYLIDKANPRRKFQTRSVSWRTNTKAIDNFKNRHGFLPKRITEAPKRMKVYLSVVKSKAGSKNE